MPLDTFDPPEFPNIGSNVDASARVNMAAFGDGYSQRAVDGLNPIARTLTLEWRHLTKAQAQTIWDFFEAKSGATAFLYQPPKEAVALKWICQRWRRASTAPNNAMMSATFTQVFDL